MQMTAFGEVEIETLMKVERANGRPTTYYLVGTNADGNAVNIPITREEYIERSGDTDA